MIETKASHEAIWNIWQDVKNWHTWDNVTEYYSIDGPFQQGTKGTYKAKGGRQVQLVFTQVEPFKVYVVECRLFLAWIISSHYLSKSNGRTQVIQQLEINGPLALFFAYHLSSTLKKNLLIEMASLVKKAESIGS